MTVNTKARIEDLEAPFTTDMACSRFNQVCTDDDQRRGMIISLAESVKRMAAFPPLMLEQTMAAEKNAKPFVCGSCGDADCDANKALRASIMAVKAFMSLHAELQRVLVESGAELKDIKEDRDAGPKIEIMDLTPLLKKFVGI